MSFFKRIFQKEPQQEAVKAIELKEWLASKAENMHSQLDEEIDETYSKIKKLKKEVMEKLENLEFAKLMNPDISAKEKKALQDHRDNYIVKTENFIKGIMLPEREYSLITDFCDVFEKDISSYNESTAKAYYFLRNYFDKEVYEVAATIKKIEDNVLVLMRTANHDSIKEYKSLQQKIRELNEMIVETDRIQAESDNLKIELESAEYKKKSIKDKMESLKEGNEYSKFKNIERKRKELDDRRSELKAEMVNAIKSFDKALKKEAHSTGDKLIEEYLDDPLEAVEKDTSLKILPILSKLEKKVEKNKDLKDKDKSKLLKSMAKIDEGYLMKIKEDLDSIRKNKRLLSEEQEKITIMMNFKELEYQLEHIENKIEKLSSDISERESKAFNFQADKKAKKLEKQLSEFTGVDVQIEL